MRDHLLLVLLRGQLLDSLESCCLRLVISRGHTYPTHLGTSPSYHKKTTRKKK